MENEDAKDDGSGIVERLMRGMKRKISISRRMMMRKRSDDDKSIHCRCHIYSTLQHSKMLSLHILTLEVGSECRVSMIQCPWSIEG